MKISIIIIITIISFKFVHAQEQLDIYENPIYLNKNDSLKFTENLYSVEKKGKKYIKKKLFLSSEYIVTKNNYYRKNVFDELVNQKPVQIKNNLGKIIEINYFDSNDNKIRNRKEFGYDANGNKILEKFYGPDLTLYTESKLFYNNENLLIKRLDFHYSALALDETDFEYINNKIFASSYRYDLNDDYSYNKDEKESVFRNRVEIDNASKIEFGLIKKESTLVFVRNEKKYITEIIDDNKISSKRHNYILNDNNNVVSFIIDNIYKGQSDSNYRMYLVEREYK